ncbi:MAG: metallophosphoesterase family protein [Deltaproteobacteria bacterium]|nr:MAG: metallophosphoesterase family protein [Deltaproteobacteria bacterium]
MVEDQIGQVRIAVLSDTHLHRVTPEFRKTMVHRLQGVGLVLHAGDWVGSEVLDFLETYPLAGVFGNMDDAIIRSRLPYKRVVEVNGFRLGLIHGSGSRFDLEKRIRQEFKEVEVIVYGHSHRPISHWDDGILFLNPGSAMQNRGVDHNTMGFITVGQSIHAQIVRL